MFKNNSYKKNNIIFVRRRGVRLSGGANAVQELPSGVVPKQIEKHDVKSVVKPNINKNNNYENIRNIVENNEQESISKPVESPKDSRYLREVKNLQNKLNIV
jgi:hypothetical protein